MKNASEGNGVLENRDSVSEVEFISGPPVIPVNGNQVSLGEVESDRFEPKRILHRRNGKLVCLAWDRVEQGDIVLKVQRSVTGDSGEQCTFVAHEAQVARGLPRHENVLDVRDLYTINGVDGRPIMMLTMEYAEGGSLRSRLIREDAPSEMKGMHFEWFRSICAGIDAMHREGILHLDLKPENVLFSKGVIKVSDFGSACSCPLDGSAALGSASASAERSVGTVQYMAPERFDPDFHPHVTSDIYSLGVILYELISPRHRPPFTGSYGHIRRLHREGELPLFRKILPEEASFIGCCMAKRPKDRFQSVDELMEQFESVYAVCAERRSSELSPDDDQDRRAVAQRLIDEILCGMDSGDLEELLALAHKVSELDPDNQSLDAVVVRLSLRARRFNEAIEACAFHLESARLESALKYAGLAKAVNPNSVLAARLDAELSFVIDEADRLKSAMNEAATDRDFERAIDLAGRLDELGIPT